MGLPLALQPLYALLVVHRDAHSQDALGLAAAHRQQTMAGTTLQRLVPVEVVGIFRSLVGIGFRLDDLRGDESRATEAASDTLARALVLAHHLSNDVLCALQRGLGIGDVAFDKAAGRSLGVRLALLQQQQCQRLQPLLAGHLRTCPALRLVGQIDVLQLRGIPARRDALFQLGRQLLLLGDGLRDGLLALLDLLQAVVLFADGSNLHLVQRPRAFLSVACDERDRGTVVQQRQRSSHLFLVQPQALSNQFCEHNLSSFVPCGMFFFFFCCKNNHFLSQHKKISL